VDNELIKVVVVCGWRQQQQLGAPATEEQLYETRSPGKWFPHYTQGLFICYMIIQKLNIL